MQKQKQNRPRSQRRDCKHGKFKIAYQNFEFANEINTFKFNTFFFIENLVIISCYGICYIKNAREVAFKGMN